MYTCHPRLFSTQTAVELTVHIFYNERNYLVYPLGVVLQSLLYGLGLYLQVYTYTHYTSHGHCEHARSCRRASARRGEPPWITVPISLDYYSWLLFFIHLPFRFSALLQYSRDDSSHDKERNKSHNHRFNRRRTYLFLFPTPWIERGGNMHSFIPVQQYVGRPKKSYLQMN